MYFLRHLLSILILPFTVTVIVPAWLASNARGVRPGGDLPQPWAALAVAGGVLLMAAGLTLLARTIALFATRGRGTLAPWDPPRRLVMEGVYRHVRNPMISGVISIVAGEGLLLGLRSVAEWAALFAVINFIYIPLLEEPFLRERFGDHYDEYRRHVPRWIPRLRPWVQTEKG
ncbi:MAG TPA: isoprenylcysteine carboxylmethyltransferase family protein [Longimicrobium sp.]|jgi:protein-S-isoprenylcysteine O-methyltransferase Ste14